MLKHIIDGGPLMVPLLICSILALAVVLDRAVAFYRNSQIDTRSLRAKVLSLLREGRANDAASLCAATPSPVSAVLLVGLQSYAKHDAIKGRTNSITTVVEKAMEDYSLQAVSMVEKRLAVLSSVGNVAPLLGMAGTVTGMISAFGAMAGAGGLDASVVAAGISEALVTTAAGLLIAIGAVIPFTYFTAAADRIALEIEEASSELIDFVATEAGLSGKGD